MNPFDLLNHNPYDISKTINQKFPRGKNRNWQPIISDEMNDLVKDRYKKVRISTLLIDSRDRNYRAYPYPNNYKIQLGRQFNYIQSIQLKSLQISSFPITATKITWSFPFSIDYSTNIPCGEYNSITIGKVMQNYMNIISGFFYIFICASINEICIINRIEEFDILAIQTILNVADDIFSGGVSANKGIYILVNGQLDTSSGDIPIIPTDIPNIGGYSKELFNLKEFYFQSTTQNSYDYVDTVTINGKNYYRYILVPLVDGNNIYTSQSENIINSQGIKDVINGDTTNFKGVYNNGISKVGRAREFTFNFEESPLLTKIFNWFECKSEHRFVLCNKSDYNLCSGSCFSMVTVNNYVDNRDQWLFRNDEYILLKLNIPFRSSDILSGNLIKTQNQSQSTKIDNNLFAMIDLLEYPYKINTSILKFYDTPLEKMNELVIEFVDRIGYPIDIKCNHTIVLEVLEYIDVLKDTLIDSRHGEVVTTGINHV